MFFSKTKKGADMHRDGHPFGRRQKKQSQGNNNRKQGSFQRSKPRRGQGK